MGGSNIPRRISKETVMTIEIKNQQKQIPIPRAQSAQIQRIVQKILRREGVRVSHARLSIVFVTDSKIQSLNKKFLNRSYTTDVLAFDLSEDVLSCSSKKIKTIEGEIVISATTAIKNARIFATSPHQELMLYVIHGILHLMGYDDHKAADIKHMRAKEIKLMKLVGKQL